MTGDLIAHVAVTDPAASKVLEGPFMDHHVVIAFPSPLTAQEC